MIYVSRFGELELRLTFRTLMPQHYLPLVSREWKNGSNSSYNCTPFLHFPLTKGKIQDSDATTPRQTGRPFRDTLSSSASVGYPKGL